MRKKLSKGLWRNRDFKMLWAGETISLFGSHVTFLALPLMAVLVLDATPTQMGYLGAAHYLPFLLVTLFAGVWVDRHRRRPILIVSNLGRALLIGLIPLLAFSGKLTMGHLYVVVFLVGILTVFFDLAYNAYVPALVSRPHLIEANSKLQASESAAELGGPGLAGILVELVNAPFALLLDALSFLASAASLILIRGPEPNPVTPPRLSLIDEIKEGLRITFDNAYLRPIVAEAATFNLFWTVIETVFVIFATRELDMGPGLLGIIISAGSLGALSGALIAQPAAARWGIGPTILGAMVAACSAFLLVPITPRGLIVPALLLVYFVVGLGSAVSNIHVISLRQTLTPDHLLGRMTAGYRMVIFGAFPVGALLGGFLGEQIGTSATLTVGALGLLMSLSWVIFSPVRMLRQLPPVIQAAGTD